MRGFLKVPLVKPPPLDDRAFDALRTTILDASPSAMRANDAARLATQRERALLAAAKSLEPPPPPPEPEDFREPVRKPRKPKT